MILRLSSSAQRGALVLGASFAAVFLSYFGIRNARADHFAGLPTRQALERATELEPGDARNWYLLGRYWQFNLEDSDAQKAIGAYKTAVSVDPRSTVSWLGLGSVYESVGDFAHAGEAFLQAKKVYPLSGTSSGTKLPTAIPASPSRSGTGSSQFIPGCRCGMFFPL